MKMNKIKALAPAATLLLSMGLTSCMADLDDGNIDPNATGSVDVTGFYTKCYASLIMEGLDGNADFSIDDNGKSTLLRNVFNFSELSTDEAICWWSDGDITEVGFNRTVPGTPILKFLYYRLVSNISYCNSYIQISETQGDKTRLAEVRFIRAYNYFLMLDYFGDPAFTDKITTETPLQAHAHNGKYEAGKNYSRAELLAMGREFLFNWIKGELEAIQNDLLPAQPETDSDPNYGRVDQGTCWLLLSRLYLNAGTYLNNDGQKNPYWKEAKDYAEKVINSNYALFDDTKISGAAKAAGYQPYDLLFMGDNGSNGASCEALLPLLQDGKKTKGWGGSLFFVAAMWNPSMKTVTDRDAGTTGNNWSGMRCRPQLIEKFVDNPSVFLNKTTKEIREMGIDDRALFWGQGYIDDVGTWRERTVELKDNSSFAYGLVTTKWNNNYSTGQDPHDSYDVDTDFFLFRVAEAYLNAAEALMHLNGEGDGTAKNYLNALRNRAHAGEKNSFTLNDVLDERAREFYFEGQRRTDLIRFNQYGGASTYMWDFKAGAEKGATFEKYRNVYPIPTTEVMANRNLTQIDGYTQIDN